MAIPQEVLKMIAEGRAALGIDLSAPIIILDDSDDDQPSDSCPECEADLSGERKEWDYIQRCPYCGTNFS